MTKTNLGAGLPPTTGYTSTTPSVGTAQQPTTTQPLFQDSEFGTSDDQSALLGKNGSPETQAYLYKLLTLDHPDLAFDIPAFEQTLAQQYSDYTANSPSVESTGDSDTSPADQELANDYLARAQSTRLTSGTSVASQSAIPTKEEIQTFLKSMPQSQLLGLYQQYMVTQYPPGASAPTPQASNMPSPDVDAQDAQESPPAGGKLVPTTQALSTGGSAGISQEVQEQIDQATDLLQQNQFDQAFALLQKITKNPQVATAFPRIDYLRGMAAEYATDTKIQAQAGTFYKQYLNSGDNDVDTKKWVTNELVNGIPAQALIAQGNAAFSAQNPDYGQALSQFRKALELNPSLMKTMPEINYYLGVCSAYTTPPNYKAAEGYYNRYLATPGADEKTKAWVQNQVGQGIPAQKAFQEGMNFFNGHDVGDQQALKAYQDTLKINPSLAQSLYQSSSPQDYGKALEKFQAALKRDPSLAQSMPGIFYYMGVAAEYAGNTDPKLAQSYYQQYLSAPQSDAQTAKWVKDELGWLKVKDAAGGMVQKAQDEFYTDNDPQAALATLQKAMAQYPALKTRDASNLFSLAQYAFYAGKTDLAKQYLGAAQSALDEWQKGLDQSQQAMAQAIPGSSTFAQAQQNFQYYQSMIQQFGDLKGQLSGGAFIGHLSNWLTTALGGGKFGSTIGQGFLNMWIGAGQFGQFHNATPSADPSKKNAFEKMADYTKRTRAIGNKDITIGNDIADKLSGVAHLETESQLYKMLKELRSQELVGPEPEIDQAKAKLDPEQERLARVEKQNQELENRVALQKAIADYVKANDINLKKFEDPSAHQGLGPAITPPSVVVAKLKEKANQEKQKFDTTVRDLYPTLEKARATLVSEIQSMRQEALHTSGANVVKKTKLKNELQAKEKQLEAVDSGINQMISGIYHHTNMQALVAKQEEYAHDKAALDELNQHLDNTEDGYKPEDLKERSRLRDKLKATAQEIQEMQNQSVKLTTADGATTLTETKLNSDGSKTTNNTVVNRDGNLIVHGDVIGRDGKPVAGAENAGGAFYGSRTSKGGGLTVDGGLEINKGNNSRFGPGWWGLGETLGHSQSVAKTFKGQLDLGTAGTLTAQGDALNAEARTYQMIYGGSTGSGIGLGGQFGAQSRANIADANYDMQHQGGTTTIGGVTINNLFTSDTNAQASLGAGAGAEAGFGVGSKGADISAGVNAFAGAQYGGMVGASVDGMGGNIMGQAWDGVGVKFDPSIHYQNGKLNLHLGFGAALGVGGYEGVNYTLDFNQIGRELQGVFTDWNGMPNLIRDTVGGIGGVDSVDQAFEKTISQFEMYAKQADNAGDHQTAQEMRDYIVQVKKDEQTQKDVAYAGGAVGLLTIPTRIRWMAAANKLLYQGAVKGGKFVAEGIGSGLGRLADYTGLSATRAGQAVSSAMKSAREAAAAAKVRLASGVDEMVTKVGKSAEALGARVSKAAGEALDVAKAGAASIAEKVGSAVSAAADAIKTATEGTRVADAAAAAAAAVSKVAAPLAEGVSAALKFLGEGASAAFKAVEAVAAGVSDATAATLAIPFVGEIMMAIAAVISGVTSELDDKNKLDDARKRKDFDEATIKTLQASATTIDDNLKKCQSSLADVDKERDGIKEQLADFIIQRQQLTEAIWANANDPRINSDDNRDAINQLSDGIKKLTDSYATFTSTHDKLTDSIQKLNDAKNQIPVAVKKLQDDANDQDDTIDQLKKLMGADWFLGIGTNAVDSYHDLKKGFDTAQSNIKDGADEAKHASNVKEALEGSGKVVLGALEDAGSAVVTGLDTAVRSVFGSWICSKW